MKALFTIALGSCFLVSLSACEPRPPKPKTAALQPVFLTAPRSNQLPLLKSDFQSRQQSETGAPNGSSASDRA